MPTARINGHTMYYETHGEGPALLCLSGWGTICHGRTNFLPHSFLEDGYQLVFFDHRGIGESEDIPAVPHTTDLYAEDAVALLDHLGIAKAHVAGLGGMGALIGQKIAIKFPDRVSSLSMFGGWAKPDHYLGDQLRLLDALHEKIGWSAYQMGAALFCYTPELYNEKHDHIISANGPWQMIKEKQPIHGRFVKACLAHDTTADLHKIKQPTLIAVGDVQDLMTGARIASVLKAGIPHAEYVVIENSPHAHQAYPLIHERFSQVFGDFVRRQAKAG